MVAEMVQLKVSSRGLTLISPDSRHLAAVTLDQPVALLQHLPSSHSPEPKQSGIHSFGPLPHSQQNQRISLLRIEDPGSTEWWECEQ